MKEEIAEIIKKYEDQEKAESHYYLGMSDEDSAYVDGVASILQEILTDLRNLDFD